MAPCKIYNYPGYIFYGEFFGKGIQRAIDYGEKKLRIFDIYSCNAEKFIDFYDMFSICREVGFDIVPFNITDAPPCMCKIEELANEQSSIAHGSTKEGIVIRRLNEIVKKDKRWIYKFKSKKWEETNKQKDKLSGKNAIHDKAALFASEVVTPGRIANIAEHMARDGDIELNIERTKEFINALLSDITDEHSEALPAIKKELSIYKKKIQGRGVYLWKEYLNNLWR